MPHGDVYRWNFKVAVLLGVVASVAITRITSAQLIGNICAPGKYSPCEPGFASANITAPYRATCYNVTAAFTPKDLSAMHAVRCYSPSLGYGASPQSTYVNYTGAFSVCDSYTKAASDWHLPITVVEAGTACGSGEGLDGQPIWLIGTTLSPTHITASPTTTPTTASPTTNSPPTATPPTDAPLTASPTTASPTTSPTAGAQGLGQVLNHCQRGIINNDGDDANVCNGNQAGSAAGMNPDAPADATGNDRYFARTNDSTVRITTCYNQYATASETTGTSLNYVRCFSPSIKLGHSGSPCTNTLANAITYCEGYTGDGASDWRLPQTVEEAGYTCGSGSGSGCGSLGFLGGGGDSTDQWVLFPASSPTIP